MAAPRINEAKHSTISHVACNFTCCYVTVATLFIKNYTVCQAVHPCSAICCLRCLSLNISYDRSYCLFSWQAYFQGSKIVLVRSYLRVSQAAGQVNILILHVKIKFSPCMPIIFVKQGKCLFSDISRPDFVRKIGNKVSNKQV